MQDEHHDILTNTVFVLAKLQTYNNKRWQKSDFISSLPTSVILTFDKYLMFVEFQLMIIWHLKKKKKFCRVTDLR